MLGRMELNGRLGDGSESKKDVPVDVKGLEPGTDKGVTAVSAGGSHTCAMVRGGLQCWGSGGHGELGDDSTTDRKRPVNVVGLEPGKHKGLSAVSAGEEHTCAVLKGGIKCWGYADSGKLGLAGISSFNDVTTPMDVQLFLF